MYAIWFFIKQRHAMHQPLVSSKKLAAVNGVTLSTVHYYTTVGLLRVRRRVGNKRLYDYRESHTRLKQVARLRQQGYSLALIRQVLEKRTVGV